MLEGNCGGWEQCPFVARRPIGEMVCNVDAGFAVGGMKVGGVGVRCGGIQKMGMQRARKLGDEEDTRVATESSAVFGT